MHAGPTEAENGIALGTGSFSWGTGYILCRHQVCQVPCGVHLETLGPEVRFACLQGIGDGHPANSINNGESPSTQTPTCAAPGPTISAALALLGCVLRKLSTAAHLSVNSFLPVTPHQGLQPRPASLRFRATDPVTLTSSGRQTPPMQNRTQHPTKTVPSPGALPQRMAPPSSHSQEPNVLAAAS